MIYDIKQIDKWEAPKEDSVAILTCPNVALPMHNCFREDAEVLTSMGWKKIIEATTNDLLATWDKDTEKIVWDHPYETIKAYSKQLVRIKQKNYKTFSTLVTPEHRIPVRAKRDPRRQRNNVRFRDGDKDDWYLHDTTAAKLNVKSFKHFITAARNGTSETTSLRDEEKVYIALQADGSIRRAKMESEQHNNRYADTRGLYSFRITLKRPRKKERLESLLLSSGVKFTKQAHRSDSLAAKNTCQRYDVWVPYNCKNFWQCFDITTFSQRKAQEFLDEIAVWDGSCEETCGILNRRYVTTVEDNAKFAQAVAVVAGVTSSLQVKQRGGNAKTAYIIDFLDRDFRTVQSCVKEVVEHDDYVYCVNVPTSYLVIRDGESKSVMITGNCCPRTIDPKAWEKMRKQCYMDANYTCQATGDELGRGKCHAHELISIDWTNQTETFERTVCLSPPIHTRFIHSGRALTLFQRHDKYFPKEALIATLEYGFSLISQWNAEHPDEEPLRVSDTFLEWEKNPDLHYDVARLIEQYNIKFYTFDKKCFNKTNWPKWKLVYNGKEYPTKFATKKEWEDHFAPVENPVDKVELPSDVQAELDKMLGEEK